jgi:hypothetical protein
MAYKIVDTKGTVYSHHTTIDDAERELQENLDASDADPASTFVSAAPPYRIVEESRQWVFNAVTNRYEWMLPQPPPRSTRE